MLVAHDQDDQRVLAWNAHKGQIYFCPECSRPVIARQGQIVIWHFAHKVRGSCAAEGESPEHLKMKQWVYEWFKQSPTVTLCELEWRLPEIRRRADLYVEAEWGRVAIECQVSSMSFDDLHSKIGAYKSAGIAPLYIISRGRLGKSSCRDVRDLGRVTMKPLALAKYLLALYGVLYVYQPALAQEELHNGNILPEVIGGIVPVSISPNKQTSMLSYASWLTLYCCPDINPELGMEVKSQKKLAYFAGASADDVAQQITDSLMNADNPMLRFLSAKERIDAARTRELNALNITDQKQRWEEINAASVEREFAFADFKRARVELIELGYKPTLLA